MVTRRDPGMETCLFSSLLVVGSGLVISPYRCGLNPSGLLLSVIMARRSIWGELVPRNMESPRNMERVSSVVH
jgi:hypothetical protein